MTSVIDMAKYSMAIDQNQFVKKETQDHIFSPTISTNGDTLPYGLGWFIQEYKGIKFVWHYGLWNTNSSIIIKVPEKNLTLVVLANTNNLCLPFSLGQGDLFTSPVSVDFLKKFVITEKNLPDINYELSVDDLKKQITEVRTSTYQDLLKKEL